MPRVSFRIHNVFPEEYMWLTKTENFCKEIIERKGVFVGWSSAAMAKIFIEKLTYHLRMGHRVSTLDLMAVAVEIINGIKIHKMRGQSNNGVSITLEFRFNNNEIDIDSICGFFHWMLLDTKSTHVIGEAYMDGSEDSQWGGFFIVDREQIRIQRTIELFDNEFSVRMRRMNAIAKSETENE